MGEAPLYCELPPRVLNQINVIGQVEDPITTRQSLSFRKRPERGRERERESESASESVHASLHFFYMYSTPSMST